MVDNTSGEDWTHVALSLVSGRPISFVSQLYAPKYVDRPSADLPDDAAAQPVIHAGGYAAAPPPPPVPAAAPHAMVARSVNGRAEGNAGGVLGSLMLDAKAVAPSSIVADAAGRELGELFEYRIAQPVTIRKNESALLPFLQQQIDARKLLIYSGGNSEHPTNAAELTNSTGKTLDGGPVTVYDGGAYGGKAAVVREIHVSRGVLSTRLAAEETRTYTLRNVDPKAKTLILEHPLRAGYTLLNQKPSEKTSSAYRFEIALASGATREFAVSEERVYEQSYQVSSLTPDAILDYVRNRELNDAARRQLQPIADQKRQVADTERALSDAAQQIASLTSDEERIRQNIGTLGNVAGQQQQVQKYASQLDDHERQLAALRDQQADLQKKKAALEADLARMIEALKF
jgi:chaperonin cofactor prefoldin